MTLDKQKGRAVLARTALVATTIFWGSSFVVLKNTLDSISVIWLLALRFSLAAVFMCLFGIRSLKRLDKAHLLAGAALGFLLFAAYLLQTYGLVFTTPGKNAFLTATYCVLTPFLMRLIYKTRLNALHITAGFVCLIGMGFVSLGKDFSVGFGDLLTICCGLFYAMHIIITGRVAGKLSITMLSMVQFAVAGLLALGTAAISEPFPRQLPVSAFAAIGYLAVFCTCLCFVFQTFGQKYTSASSAAIIMTLEAVFGALCSAIFYHERMTFKLIIGFALIFGAVVLSEAQWKPRDRGLKQQ